jgi:hypothetical protein
LKATPAHDIATLANASADAIQDRLHFEMHLTDIANDFKNLLYDRIDAAITDAQHRISEHLGIDRSLLWERISSHFGGTKKSKAISWPEVIKDKGGIRNQFPHAVDIAAGPQGLGKSGKSSSSFFTRRFSPPPLLATRSRRTSLRPWRRGGGIPGCRCRRQGPHHLGDGELPGTVSTL